MNELKFKTEEEKVSAIEELREKIIDGKFDGNADEELDKIAGAEVENPVASDEEVVEDVVEEVVDVEDVLLVVLEVVLVEEVLDDVLDVVDVVVDVVEVVLVVEVLEVQLSADSKFRNSGILSAFLRYYYCCSTG